MPADKVAWVLDGRQPGDTLDIRREGYSFREFFGVSQEAMEKRLYDLGYRCQHGRYKYARPPET
jgi:hypothetical protein